MKKCSDTTQRYGKWKISMTLTTICPRYFPKLSPELRAYIGNNGLPDVILPLSLTPSGSRIADHSVSLSRADSSRVGSNRISKEEHLAASKEEKKTKTKTARRRINEITNFDLISNFEPFFFPMEKRVVFRLFVDKIRSYDWLIAWLIDKHMRFISRS